jgi:uncharacterized protein YbjT (DUF2867 family)
MLEPKTITIFGGSGFLGRYVVKLLCLANYRVKIVSSNPEQCAFLKTAGTIGQVNCIYGDICQPETIRHALQNTDIVINMVGIFSPRGKRTFSNIHAKGAESIAKIASQLNIKQFIHVSALGIDKARASLYIRSKLNGEKAILNAYPNATILRPAIMFGPEDKFISQFAKMSYYLPVIPLIGTGHNLIQPVYVLDVAHAVVACINNTSCYGKIYELSGPHTYRFKDLMKIIINIVGKKRILVPLPFSVASFLIFFLEKIFPFSLKTEQIKLLKHNLTANKDALGFKELGITPQPLEGIIIHY